MVFCPVTTGPEALAAVRALPAGGILMLENVRRNRGEKMNDESFARELAKLADVFVQDSFDVCHRAHASVVGVPAFLPSYAGLLVEEEVRELSRALKPKSPSLAIIGGAKFATKEAVLKRLLSIWLWMRVSARVSGFCHFTAGRDGELYEADARRIPQVPLPDDGGGWGWG